MINSVEPEQIRPLAQTFDIPYISLWLKICQEKAKKGSKHGYVHQDLVNLLGEKLGFNVTYGKYTLGFDGLWKYDDLSIIIESKANIQWKGTLSEAMNFVSQEHADYGLVVSSQFNDEDLNTVKGPTYSAKLRLITTDALCKLASLKKDDVLTTENVKDILIPQESHLLDNIIDLIHGIWSTKREIGVTEKGVRKERCIDDVPKDIKDLGEVSKAMYIVLKHNPDKNYESWELTEEITKNFPSAFANKNPGFGLPWSGDALKRRGYTIIERYLPDPENYPEWYKRRYKFKKQ